LNYIEYEQLIVKSDFHKGKEDINNGCASVTLYSHKKENLPKINMIGDILIIHRANIS
jgi:hypothetical protein